MEFDATKAIWSQLVTEFSRRIATGEWAAGARIDSVRELAADLGVNPNTVQRALGELDRLGLTAPERTAGRFVTTDVAQIRSTRLALAASGADEFIEHMRGLGLTEPEALDLLSSRWETIAKEHQ